MKIYKNKIRIFVSIVVTFVFGFGFLSAWTGPTANPATPNAPAPINVSSTFQLKEGSLRSNTDMRAPALYDYPGTTYYIDWDGNSKFKNIYSDEIRSGIFYDYNNYDYYMNPAGESVFSTLKIKGGSPGAGKVLTSDATGAASWVTPATFTETDPQVGTLTNGKWCTTNGTSVNCTNDAPTSGLSGSGTTNYLPKFTAATTLGNSVIYNNGANIGIGTVSPQTNLVVHDSSKWSVITASSGAGDTGINMDSDSWRNKIRTDLTGGRMFFFVNNLSNTGAREAVTILQNGNVGIGTASPTHRLSVAGNVSVGTIDGTSSSYYLTTGKNSSNPMYGGIMAFGDAQGIYAYTTGTYGSGVIGSANLIGVQAISRNTSHSEGRGLSATGYTGVWSDGVVYDFYGASTNGKNYFGGDVGIGTANPTQKLDVNGYVKGTGLCIGSTCKTSWPTTGITAEADTLATVTGRGGTTSSAINVSSHIQTDYLYVDPQNSSGEGGEIQLRGSGSYGDFQIDNYQGNARIHSLGSGKYLEVIGGGGIKANSFINFSDKNLKKDISLLPDALEKVLLLEGISFKWRDDEEEKVNLGVIAQDVEKVFPEVVHTDSETGLKSVEYANLVAPLIEAVKELSSKIGDLFNKYFDQQNQIDNQQDQIDYLMQEVKKLKYDINQ